MSRVPFWYCSRGQPGSPDWPDPDVDLVAAVASGETRNAPITITHWSKKVLIDFIGLKSDRPYPTAPMVSLAIGL